MKEVYNSLSSEWYKALSVDHHQGKGGFIAHISVFNLEVDWYIEHIDRFCGASMEHEVDSNFATMPSRCYIKYEGLGVVLSMGSWNYPIFTTLGPMLNAVATGNTVILKPSEMSPTFSATIATFIRDLNFHAYACFEGGPEVAIELTASKFDLIVFTGSPMKGKLVAASAAKNLVPCVLELGGKCPFIVDESADIEWAVKKLAMKFGNAGQTCITADYSYIHESVYDEFVKKLLILVKEQYVNKQDMGSIINDFHYKRVMEYLTDDHKGKVLMGNQTFDEKLNYIEPTIVENPSEGSKMMIDEIFGPILSLFKFKQITDVIQYINSHEHPLAIYYFGDNSGVNCKRVLDETETGAFVCNDFTVQVTNSYLPFGGVGSAGYGRYNGFSSVNWFCNPKAVMIKSNLYKTLDKMSPSLDPPYTDAKLKEIHNVLGGSMTSLTQWKVGGFFRHLLYFLLLVLIAVLVGVYWDSIVHFVHYGTKGVQAVASSGSATGN